MRIDLRNFRPAGSDCLLEAMVALAYIYFWILWHSKYLSLIYPSPVLLVFLWFIFMQYRVEEELTQPLARRIGMLIARLLYLLSYFVPMVLLWAWHWRYLKI